MGSGAAELNGWAVERNGSGQGIIPMLRRTRCAAPGPVIAAGPVAANLAKPCQPLCCTGGGRSGGRPARAAAAHL